MTFDESELRELLTCYTVPVPPETLVRRTKVRMYREQATLAAAPAAGGQWIFALTGLALMMALCLFYTLMVETVLQFFVPAGVAFYLQKSLMVLTAAGGTFIAAIFVLMAMKYVLAPRAQNPAYDYVRIIGNRE